MFTILCEEMSLHGKLDLPLLNSPKRGNVRHGTQFEQDMRTLLRNICLHIVDSEIEKDITAHFELAILASKHYNDPDFTLVLESKELGKLGAVLDWKTPVFVHCRLINKCIY